MYTNIQKYVCIYAKYMLGEPARINRREEWIATLKNTSQSRQSHSSHICNRWRHEETLIPSKTYVKVGGVRVSINIIIDLRPCKAMECSFWREKREEGSDKNTIRYWETNTRTWIVGHIKLHWCMSRGNQTFNRNGYVFRCTQIPAYVPYPIWRTFL